MSEIERYNGLTTADKGALLDAKARGAEWVARDTNNDLYGYAVEPIDDVNYGWTTPFIGNVITINPELMKFVAHHEKVNIDLALAQIEEMESKQNNALSEKANEKGCMTWNERINQMTVEEKAELFDSFGFCVGGFVTDEECNANKNHYNCAVKWLNSPYTEGETK